MGLIIKELQSVARKEEVKVLEKYINLWNPIKFVTSNEVEQIVNDALERKQKRAKIRIIWKTLNTLTQVEE